MEKNYDPARIEQHWYDTWETGGYFQPSAVGTPYCIMIPPPNVTGSLHMGHGFQDSLMDALIRYHRMMGRDTLWQVGTDHAGIATQMVVERQLAAKNIRRQDLGREAFVEKIWEWKAESGSNITRQLRRMGASVDWDRERFTMDEGLSQAVQKVFIQLFDEGLIYRGERLVNWDTKFQTAISDLEVQNIERESQLVHINYPLSDGSGAVTIVTQRPETIPGDMAVAVHPDDERYQHWIGKMVQLPLCDREIPIIADSYVDPNFGTGCLKITPAHDFNDFEVGKRHHLALLNIFTPNGHLNENVPEPYRGLDRFVAREKIVADLTELGLVVHIEKYKTTLPVGDRSNEIVEPYLTKQWYVKAKPLAEPAIAAVKQGKIRFVPENWVNTYFQWLENIEDWCISRQLWWGHRIPAWYDDQENIYVGENENEVRQKYKISDAIKLHQDEDVLDTWFSSALWPFSTLGWPEKTEEFQKYYPTNVLVTGFDIIFFWVARMIMFGLKFTGEIPFHEVYVTGLIRDAHGHKMSKSKGNVLDPIDLIDGIDLESLVKKRTSGMMQPQLAKQIEASTRREFPNGISSHGTDALRFTYCALASPGRDIRFDMGRLEGYRNFCNKLWNASRYVFMNTENYIDDLQNTSREYSLADLWIQQRLQVVTNETHHYFEIYRFDLLCKTLYEFIWHDYCDWYLEFSKPVLYAAPPEIGLQRGARHTLITVLEKILRLIHPVMPFITEEIWQRTATLAGQTGESLMRQEYPKASDVKPDPTLLNDITWLQHTITSVRNIRGEMNISPSKLIPILFNKGSHEDQNRLRKHEKLLQTLLKAESLTWLDDHVTPPPSATALVGNMEIRVPLAGIIDKDAELQRLQKSIVKIEKDLLKIQTKLSKSDFVKNAPPDILEKVRGEAAELNEKISKIQMQIENIEAIK